MATSSRRGHAYVAIMIQWGGIELGKREDSLLTTSLKTLTISANGSVS